MTRALYTSHDGQWAAARDGREVVLFANGAGAPVGRLELTSDDADVVFVGPPAVLVTVARDGASTAVVLHPPPYLDAAARHDLDGTHRVIATAGPRLVLAAPEAKQVSVIRAAGRALAAQTIDLASPIDFAVGMPRDQILFGLLKKLEIWDAVSGRPLLRPTFQLPPPPRAIGAAQGHLWATRPGSDEVFIYRLSDGRPFRHFVGAHVDDVISHPASPVIVLATPRGLVRLHCFAHSLTLIDNAPWTPPAPDAPAAPLALLAVGEDVSMIGLPGGDLAAEPWRVAVGGSGAPTAAPAIDAAAAEPALVSVADKLRAMRAGPGSDTAPAASAPSAPSAGVYDAAAAAPRPGSRAWRDPLVAFGQELVRGIDGEVPLVAVDAELGELAHRLGLAAPARRALVALYALHLVGEPALPIARLYRAVGDWTEPLGQGELGQLAMLRREDGKVALERAVTDLLDGVPPRAIRIVGGGPTPPRAGAFRVSRDARADAAIEAELATQLGRIGVVEGELAVALLEARLYGATCVALGAPPARPRPWPRDAGLVLVLYGTATSWVADLPTLG